MLLTVLTLPFVKKEPITAQQLIAIDIIQISEKTQLPFAPKAREIIEKIKKSKEDIFPIIPDVRFDYEVASVKDNGGAVIHIQKEVNKPPNEIEEKNDP